MFDLGDTVPLAFEVLDENDELTDASAVAVTIGLPDGTSTSPALVHPSTGRYTLDFVTTMVGRHTVRGTSTGPASAFADIFDVRPATPGYIVSLEDAKKHLGMAAATTRDDEELRGFIEAATEVVEDLAGEVIVRRTVVERRPLTGDRKVALSYAPVVSMTTIAAVDGSRTWDPAGWDVDPAAAVLTALPGTSLWRGDVAFTYVAGYPLVPARYTRAALMVLRHLWETQRASLGGSRGATLGGQQTDDSFVYSQGYAIPRAAAELIRSPMPGLA